MYNSSHYEHSIAYTSNVALSPGIPTSFVPRQPVQATNRRAFMGGDNLFLVGALIVAGIALLLSGGVFAYDRYLGSALADKTTKLDEAKKAVNEEEIQEFVRLSTKISNVKTVLGKHIVLSQFFDTFENLTLQNVRFSSLTLTTAADGSAKLTALGTAKNFNTLAAQSNTLATEKNVKRAIFSTITLNSNNTVGFSLSAEIDPKIIINNSSAQTIKADPLTLPANTVTPPTTTTGTQAKTATTTTTTTTNTTTTATTSTPGTTTKKAPPTQL